MTWAHTKRLSCIDRRERTLDSRRATIMLAERTAGVRPDAVFGAAEPTCCGMDKIRGMIAG
jgi:hypothetical protein